MFSTVVSTASVAPSVGTEMVIGPRPRIWCMAGTGLRSQAWASPWLPSSISRKRWPSASSNSIAARPSMVVIASARFTPLSLKRAAQ
jgi:hypothetical protein